MTWLSRLFRPKVRSLEQIVADQEMSEVTARVFPLYNANLKAYLGQIDLLRAIEAKTDHRKINDMFLWGAIAACLAGRPPSQPIRTAELCFT